MSEVEELLNCTSCKQLLPLADFSKLSDTTNPTRKRRYSHHCRACRSIYFKGRNEERRQHRRHQHDYYQYLNEPCYRTAGCERTLCHWGYCRVNGIDQTPPAARDHKNQSRREKDRQKRAQQANRGGANHPWHSANNLIFKNRIESEVVV